MRLYSGLMGFFLLFASAFPAFAFTDLDSNSPFFQSLTDLEKRGIMTGYSDGSSGVSQQINRAEALKVALLSFQAEALKNDQINVDLTFSDLQKDAWYLKPVQLAFQKKIISGYPDRLFKPNQGVNLAEALKILLLAGNVGSDEKIDVPYADVDKTVWYISYVRYAYEKQLISSQSDHLLHPEKLLTRGEFAEITSRLLWSKEHENKQFPMYLHWPSFQREEHFYSINVPLGWQTIEQQTSTIIWKPDPESGQESFTRISPYSATIHIVFDQNTAKTNTEEYFKQTEQRLGEKFGKFKRFSLKGTLPSMRVDAEQGNALVSDLYVSLPNGSFLIFYTNYGQSKLQDELRRFVISLQHSLGFLEKGGVDLQSVVEETRKNVAVDRKGKEIMAKYPHLELFETDAIGVGTGPVDYYYSPLAHVTIKYERSFDVILDLREGKTSTF